RLDNPVVEGNVIAGQWKILFDGSMIRAGNAKPLELYDLATDLKETKNRVKEPGLKSLVQHLSEIGLRHRNSGGHRLVSLGVDDSTQFDFRNEHDLSQTRDGVTMNLEIEDETLVSFSGDGFGLANKASTDTTSTRQSRKRSSSEQVNDGESLKISFDQDVIVESIELSAGARGACGGSYRIGDGAELPVYCIDAHAEKYTKTNHRGILADIGVLKSGQSLTLDSGSLYDANASGSWWLQSIQIRKIGSNK
ncbi:MAG: hypothetical protein AAF664_02730, partial [Planctomycetota bacterium]